MSLDAMRTTMSNYLKLTAMIVTQQGLTNSLPSQSYNNTDAQSVVDQYVNITNSQLVRTGRRNPEVVLEDATQYGIADGIHIVSLSCLFPALLLSYSRCREPLFVELQRSMTRPCFNYALHANATSLQLVLEIRRLFISLVANKDSFTNAQRVVLADTVLAQLPLIEVGLLIVPYYQVWQDCATDNNNRFSLMKLLTSLRESWIFSSRTWELYCKTTHVHLTSCDPSCGSKSGRARKWG